MKQSQIIIENLKRACGLDVTETQLPDAMPACGVLCDETRGKTVFALPLGGKTYAFELDGAGENGLRLALLAREYSLAVATQPVDGDKGMRAFLNGGATPVGVRVGAFDYYVFAVYCKDRQKSVLEYLSAMAGASDIVCDMTDDVIAFCKKVENDSDYQSAGEFAAVLRENLAEEIKYDVKIGVGGVAHGTSELAGMYGYANSALVSGAEFDPIGNIYSYKEYALLNMLYGLSVVERERYVKTVLDKNYRAVLSDDELMTAAIAFMNHSLNISEASRSMYVHRNTLIYRLDKIEKMTGLNIRSFNDAMTFRAAYLIFKTIK